MLFPHIIPARKLKLTGSKFDRTQLPIIHSDMYGKYVRGLWQNVFDLEKSEEVPELRVMQTTIDFGIISYVNWGCASAAAH